MRALIARRSRISVNLRPNSAAVARYYLRQWLFAFLVLLTFSPAVAQETVTYGYDNKGRLGTVNHTTGPLAGAAATYNYDNADNRTTLVVTGTTITVNPATLPNGTVGSAYSQTISASGGLSPYTYQSTSGTLPAGLSLNSSTGLLSGTPSTASGYSFTVTATDNAGNTGSRGYSVTVANGSTNHPPVCATITMNIDHRATTTVHVTASMILSPCSDADGDTLTVTSPATPYDISVVANGPPITSVNTVSDGHGGSTTQTIQINRT